MSDESGISDRGGRGLYRLYDAAGRLLYIGIGQPPASRWKQHAKTKPWWPDVARKTVEWYAKYRDAEVAEIEAIKRERPMYNVAHAPAAKELAALVSKVGGPAEAARILAQHLDTE